MKHFKLMALLLSILLSTHLKAETIKQSFTSDEFPSYGSETPGAVDGWSYVYLSRNTDSADRYYGPVGYLSSPYESSWSSYPNGSLTSPSKEGGVGWISFWYKNVTSTSYTVEGSAWVQVSTDGTTFETVATIPLPRTVQLPYTFFSLPINRSAAKYVRIEIPKNPSTSYAYTYMFLDELIITDAVASGVPSSISAISSSISGEVGVTTANTIALSGAGITGNVNFSFEPEGSPFALNATSASASAINAGYELGVNFTPTVKQITTGFLKISGGGLPELVYRVDGLGMERNIIDGFNTMCGPYDSNGVYNAYDYFGWQVKNGSTYNTTSNPYLVAEGERALRFYPTLISPKKIGGIGTISFQYQPYLNSATAVPPTVTFRVFVSSDGTTWTEKEVVNASSPSYAVYSKVINDANANYVKLEIDGSDNTGLMVDAMVITEFGKRVAYASGTAAEIIAPYSPYQFSIPLAFAYLTEDISITFRGTEFSTALSTIPANIANAAPTYSLAATYTPAEKKNYAKDTLVISGGGLYFPVKVLVTAYLAAETIYTGFDGDWQGAYSGTTLTDEGWLMTNASRNSSGINGSVSSAQISNGGSFVSPIKSGGVGSIEFYAKNSANYYTPYVTLAISDNGTDWTPTGDTIRFSTEDLTYKAYEYVINDPWAKYVKISIPPAGYGEPGYGSADFDNVIITANGVAISKVSNQTAPVYTTPLGVAKTQNIVLEGVNITSNLNVSFKSGAAFSAAATISAENINGKSYELPVVFKPETGTYIRDTLVISGQDLIFDKSIILTGYSLNELIYEDFNGTWEPIGSSYENYTINGWTTAYGSSSSGSNAYEGQYCLYLSANNSHGASILSIPKAGGVGTVSFYCKTSYDPARLVIRTYKELSDTPVTALDTIIAAQTPYTLLEIPVNHPDAQYIEIMIPQPTESAWPSLYVDAVTVSANGKSIPLVTIPASVSLSAYAGEKATATFNLNIQGIEKEVRLSLQSGGAYSIDKETLTPITGAINETITVTYTPTEEFFSGDVISIQSAGLPKTYPVQLNGNTLKDKLVQDFNAPGWMPDEGNGILDGWLITFGRRTSAYETPIEGAGMLRISTSTSGAGSLTSPAKSGGINKASFLYRTTYGPGKYWMETSVDGQAWLRVDSIETTSAYESYPIYHVWEKTIADSEAKYFRIQAEKLTSGYTMPYLWIDSVAIDALPYLRLVGDVPAVETSLLPVTIPVQIAGFLNNDALIGLESTAISSNFSVDKTNLSAEEVADGAIVSFDVIFNGASIETSGEYRANIKITGTDLSEAFNIPVIVEYTYTGLYQVSDKIAVFLDRNGILNVWGAPVGSRVILSNTQGQSLFNATVNSADEHFDVHLSTGVYLVKIGDKTWKVLK